MLRKSIYQTVMERLDYDKDMSDLEIYELIDDVIVMQSKVFAIGIAERGQLKKDIFYAIRKLDVLQQFIDNPDITEIMVNGKDHIFIEEKGAIREAKCSLISEEKLNNLIMQIVSKCNRRVNESSPIVDARLD